MKELDYIEFWKSIGIKCGDNVDIVSDLLNITLILREKKISFSAKCLIDALCNIISDEGNILIRSFSWNFCINKGFNYKTTKSQVGSLGNIALSRTDFKRTKHPIYSWAVFGKDKEKLTSLDYKESFGKNSIFAWELENGGKLIRIGNPKEHGFTIYHHIEEKVGVKYRYEKDFTDNYTDENGITNKKTYSMYVRNLDMNVETNTFLYIPEFEKKGIINTSIYNGINLESVDLSLACEIFENDIRFNDSAIGVKYHL